jgi:hypothetical protein
MNIIQKALASVQIGLDVNFENLTIFPLIGPDVPAADYITLDEVLAEGSSRITEVSKGGPCSGASLPQRRPPAGSDR